MRKPLSLLISMIVLWLCAHTVSPQSLSGQDRDRALMMLKAIRDDIRTHYYDAGLRGINLDERTKHAENRIKQATSNAEVFGILAQLTMEFNDSHTFFLPPQRASRTEYGWQLQTFGDDAYVIAVKPKSDAEAQGLKPGDKVLAIDGVVPSRANVWIYYYLYNVLKPRQIVNLQIQSPGEQARQLELKAKIQTGKIVFDFTSSLDLNTYWRSLEDEARMNAHRLVEVGHDIMIWRLPSFDLSEDGVDEYVDKVKKAKTLILDLRRNGGGAVETLRRLVGNLFDRDITIGNMKLRKEAKPMLAKTRGAGGFKGRLIVLVDSNSGSASEILARVVQLEKRGTVIGDRTSGKVMRSQIHPHQIGIDTVVFYAVSVTDADLIMADGQSLENIGIVPDELVLPTAEDLRSQRDSVLSRAVAMAGGTLDPVEAGKLFPFKWKP